MGDLRWASGVKPRAVRENEDIKLVLNEKLDLHVRRVEITWKEVREQLDRIEKLLEKHYEIMRGEFDLLHEKEMKE